MRLYFIPMPKKNNHLEKIPSKSEVSISYMKNRHFISDAKGKEIKQMIREGNLLPAIETIEAEVSVFRIRT